MIKENRNSEIAITGIGVVSPLGIGFADFSNAVMESRNGIKKISLFDTNPYKSKLAGEVTGFEPELFLPKKGQRYMDRSTKFLCAAAMMAINDASLEINDSNKRNTGVVVGTTFGSLKSISDFDIESLKSESPLWVNPMDFPKTTINAPASNVSILTGAMGYNTTIVGGGTSTMEAISHGMDLLHSNRLDVVLVGSVEDLNEQYFLHHSTLDILSGGKGGAERSAPFDVSGNGYVIGEGAVVFVLERVNDILEQKRRMHVKIESISQGFGGSTNHSHFSIPGSSQYASVINLALEKAELFPENIDVIAASANGWTAFDRSEAEAFAKVFTKNKPAIISAKSMLGETVSASGAFGIASAVVAIEQQKVPHILNLSDPIIPLNYVMDQPRDILVENALITSADPCGNCMAMTITGK
jgi:3-oxoacyl-[acyl-carrier-protein] synthase II